MRLIMVQHRINIPVCAIVIKEKWSAPKSRFTSTTSTSWYALLYLECKGDTHTVNVRFGWDSDMIGNTLAGVCWPSATKLTVSGSWLCSISQEKTAAENLKDIIQTKDNMHKRSELEPFCLLRLTQKLKLYVFTFYDDFLDIFPTLHWSNSPSKIHFS